MQAIKFVLFVGLISGMAVAAEKADCLKHLGGGRSDIECYLDLTASEDVKIAASMTELLKTLPKNRKTKIDIKNYIRSANANAVEFCNLKRLAVNSWEKEIADGMSEHSYGSVVYRECIFLHKKQIQADLTVLLDGYIKAQ